MTQTRSLSAEMYSDEKAPAISSGDMEITANVEVTYKVNIKQHLKDGIFFVYFPFGCVMLPLNSPAMHWFMPCQKANQYK